MRANQNILMSVTEAATMILDVQAEAATEATSEAASEEKPKVKKGSRLTDKLVD
jgi:hypothetical protein